MKKTVMGMCNDLSKIEKALTICGADLFDKTLNDPVVIKRLSEKYAKFGNVILVSSKTEIAGFAAFYNNNRSEKVGYFLEQVLL